MEKPRLVKKLPSKKSAKGNYYYEGIFECPHCKKEFKTSISNIKSGHTRSCGCNHFKNLIKHGMYNTKLYGVWSGMKERCYNPKNKKYKHYGGKNVTVCDEWKSDFMSFYKWCIKHGYKDPGKERTKIVIDRINNDGNYNPGNCRFLTYSRSQENTCLLRIDNTIGYRGVYLKKKKFKDCWFARVKWGGVYYHLGQFDTPELAAIARNNWIIEHHTFHPLNIIPHP